MRIYTNIIIGLLFVSLCLSCAEYEDDLSPIAQFSLSKDRASALEVIQLTNEGRGEFFVVYTGVNGNNYDFRDQGDVGIVANSQGDASISYDTAGIFQIAFVAVTYADGENTESVSFKTVTISDTINTIQKVNYEVGPIVRIGNSTPTVYRVEAFPTETKTINVPVFNFSQFGLTSRAQVPLMPNIIVGSTSAEFEIQNNPSFVNNEESFVVHFNFESKYRPINYTVISQSGLEEEYLVSILEIPEFEDFSVNDGLPAINRIHPSNDTEFYTSVPVEIGSDLSNLTPSFDLYFPTETTVSVNGGIVTSGSQPFDLSNEVDFLLDFKQTGFEDQFEISATSHVKAIELPVITQFSIGDGQRTITKQVDGQAVSYVIDFVVGEADITLEEETYPLEYHIDLPMVVSIEPNTLDISDPDVYRAILDNLQPSFTVSEAVSQTEVRLQNTGGVQVSGETAVGFSSYHAAFVANPSSFELDDSRVVYQIENYLPAVTSGITLDKAYSLSSIYKVAVILEND